MSDPFIGEIRMFGFDRTPRGWAPCAGQLLPINQNQALFSLLGTMYGGNGQTTFALPDLRDRAPIHVASTRPQGSVGGAATHTLTSAEMPMHTHVVSGRADPDQVSPEGALWAGTPVPGYADTADTTMAAGSLASSGGGQAHDNMPPYTGMQYCIALTGVFPSRN